MENIFKKCKPLKPSSQFQQCQTDINHQDLDQILSSLEIYEKRNQKQLKEIRDLLEENFDLRAKNTEFAPIKGKLKKLQSQNSLLKEKTVDIRRENDLLVEKIQKLQVRGQVEENISISICLSRSESAASRR